MSDPFGEAMDEAEEQSNETSDDATQRFIEALGGDGPKVKTIGFGVSEEMKYFYDEVRSADELDVNPAEEFRDHLERLANRHPEIADKARRKYEIDIE
jgi:hypothetical protein